MQEEKKSTLLKSINDCWNRIGVWSNAEERCPELGNVVHCRNCSVYSATGRLLLDREASEEYLIEWTSLLADEKKSTRTKTKSAFVFRAGTEWLALPTLVIRQVVDMGTIHSIPHLNNPVIRGLVNIQGKLEICVSIGSVLGLEREEIDDSETGYVAPERLIVTHREGKVIAFPVSDIMGVVRYQPEMMRDPPVTVSGSKAVYTEGILYHRNLDIGFLKDKLLFKTLTKDLA